MKKSICKKAAFALVILGCLTIEDLAFNGTVPGIATKELAIGG